MKKKIVALMLVVPLIVMITIFSVSKTVSLIVEVPAEDIKIVSQNDNDFLAFDMATYQNDYVLKAKVLPEEAKNKKYTTIITSLDDNKEPCISLTKDNVLVLNREGLGEVQVKSNDKGFTDSVKISVTSSKPYDYQVVASDNDEAVTITKGEETDYYLTATTGGNLKFGANIMPSSLLDADIEWTTDSFGLNIDKFSGVCNKYFSGEYIVKATLKDGVKGDIVKTTKLKLVKPTNASGITINGEAYPELIIAPNTNEIEFFIESDSIIFDSEITLNDSSNLKSVELTEIDSKAHHYKAIIKLNNATKDGDNNTIKVKGLGFDAKVTKCEPNVVTKIDNRKGERTLLHKLNTIVRYNAEVYPSSSGAKFEWTVNNDNIVITQKGDGKSVDIKANKVGTTILTLTTTQNGKVYLRNYIIEIVDQVNNISFDCKDNNGIKNMVAFASHKLNDNIYELANNYLKVIDGNGKLVSDDLLFTSLDTNIAKVNDNGLIDIVNDGVVTIKAQWKHNNYFGENINAQIKINVVKDGVYVSDSDSLLKATDEGKKIVLNNNINFAEGWTDSQIKALLNKHQVHTTFDWQYYVNHGKGRPNLNYIIEFKNNVYGNGYTINTEKITNAKDGNAPKYFRGPLDFVSVYNGMASVKGQDNMAFLARTKGITIDNINLESVSDKVLISSKDNNKYLDLSNLNYAGTTLEVMADTRIINSRIKNGRTVLRAYSGDDEVNVVTKAPLNYNQAQQQKINVTVESSVLSNAREFIIKIGSNRAVLCEAVDASSYEQNQFAGKLFNEKNKSKIYDSTNTKFNENYLLTYFTLKNSVLDTSGLFSIGMESHFSGRFLAGIDDEFSKALKDNKWYDLAATSYGALLKLEGDVRLYDWKKLDNVDSSTLIETNGTAGGGTLAKVINLNISKMIKKVSQEAEFNNVVTNIDGKDYVHGGIAFYGGGYNYSKLDLSSFTGEDFGEANKREYSINISILAKGEKQGGSNEYLQGTLLPLAAGSEDFTFYMYNKNSKFNYHKQQEDLNNGSAYGWLKGVEQ